MDEQRALEPVRDADFGDYAIHGAMREFRLLVPMLLAAAVFVLSASLPPVSRVLGFGVGAAAGAVGVFIAGVFAATLAYRLAGPRSQLYRVFDFVESLTSTWSVMVLIFASRNAVSFLWLFHLIHVLLTAAAGLCFPNAVTMAVGPLGLAVAFALAGDSASALLSLVAGLLGFAVYTALGRVHTELQQSRQREASLRLALAERRVEEERERISRDLHDRVATDLTALIWKARELAREIAGADVAGELRTFEKRLTRTLGDLRDVVTAVRASHTSFQEAVQALEQRCRELAGELPLSFVQSGELALGELDCFCDDVFLIACELMKNAVSHSGARAVSLELTLGEELLLRVSDDGNGLSESEIERSRGGLHNVRGRLRGLAGKLVLTSAGAGAALTVTLPRPLRARVHREDGGVEPSPPSGVKLSHATPVLEQPGEPAPRGSSRKLS